MSNPVSLWVLLFSTGSIAVLHALAPDHWVPFVGIGRARKWSRAKLVRVTIFCGVGHVGSSIVIGSIGLALGFSLAYFEGIESQRAQIAGLLLIGFGLAYAVWGLKHSCGHRHKDMLDGDSITPWALMIIFFLGPCEPLIPIMFVGGAQGWLAVVLACGVFAAVTLIMMVAQTLFGHSLMDLLGLKKIERHSHTAAGLVIAITGGMVMALGI